MMHQQIEEIKAAAEAVKIDKQSTDPATAILANCVVQLCDHIARIDGYLDNREVKQAVQTQS